MKIIDKVRKLCTPAYIYLVISVFALVAMMVQNAGNTNKFCLGEFECNVTNTTLILFAQGIYIIFWTFILNAICNSGYKSVSWFLVLLPFLLLAVALGMLILSDL